jgi:hypothetical protein
MTCRHNCCEQKQRKRGYGPFLVGVCRRQGEVQAKAGSAAQATTNQNQAHGAGWRCIFMHSHEIPEIGVERFTQHQHEASPLASQYLA